MIRLAGPILIAFIATLIYSGWRITVRNKQHKEENAALENLVFEIREIARKNSDIDPSAELILLKIHEYDDSYYEKELGL